jgi:hypothetical protein
VEIASNYSVLSLGISSFILEKTEENKSEEENLNNKRKVFVNKTFNILTLCSEHFMVDPESMKFLLVHAFDFNQHFLNGMPYLKGNDRQVSYYF